MMEMIKRDVEAEKISYINNSLNTFPILTEAEVAVAASIWCAKQ